MIPLQNLENGQQVVEKLFNQLSGAKTHMEFRPTSHDIINRERTFTARKIGQIHLPYTQLQQRSIKDKSPYIINDSTSSQLTTKSTVIESSCKRIQQY